MVICVCGWRLRINPLPKLQVNNTVSLTGVTRPSRKISRNQSSFGWKANGPPASPHSHHSPQGSRCSLCACEFYCFQFFVEAGAHRLCLPASHLFQAAHTVPPVSTQVAGRVVPLKRREAGQSPWFRLSTPCAGAAPRLSGLEDRRKILAISWFVLWLRDANLQRNCLLSMFASATYFVCVYLDQLLINIILPQNRENNPPKQLVWRLSCSV